MTRAAFFVDGSHCFEFAGEVHIYSYQLEWDRMLKDPARGGAVAARFVPEWGMRV